MIEDVYDGEFYKEYFEYENSFLRDKRNLFFIYNIDGVFFFKFSKFFLWSLYFVIKEFFCS